MNQELQVSVKFSVSSLHNEGLSHKITISKNPIGAVLRNAVYKK